MSLPKHGGKVSTETDFDTDGDECCASLRWEAVSILILWTLILWCNLYTDFLDGKMIGH